MSMVVTTLEFLQIGVDRWVQNHQTYILLSEITNVCTRTFLSVWYVTFWEVFFYVSLRF